MTITINTIIYDIMGALQTLILNNIPGVVAPQPDIYPTVIDTMSGQPFAMTIFKSGEGWQKGAGYSQGDYTYSVLVFLDPTAQSDIPAHVVDGALIYQRFMNVFIDSRKSSLFDPGPYQATIKSGPDGPHVSGEAPGPSLRFGGRDWYGFELLVPVRWQGPQV